MQANLLMLRGLVLNAALPLASAVRLCLTEDEMFSYRGCASWSSVYGGTASENLDAPPVRHSLTALGSGKAAFG